MTMNKQFKILFTLENDETYEVSYRLNDTLLAQKWFEKIKHMSKVPIDETISQLDDVSDLAGLYKQFCGFADIEHKPFHTIDQDLCNRLHQIYEENHDRVANKPDNGILYKFHQAIHFNEVAGKNRPKRQKN